MRRTAPVVHGIPVGRHRDWISITTLSVPTVWMASAEGLMVLDLVAVELAVNGRRKSGWKLTGPEIAYGADVLLRRGMDRTVIARRLGMDHRTLRTWFPDDDTSLSDALTRVRTQAEWSRERAKQRAKCPPSKPPAPCGTYQGAQRHTRAKEPLDELCLEARRAGDRYYREHGTYIGAPKFTAAAP